MELQKSGTFAFKYVNILRTDKLMILTITEEFFLKNMKSFQIMLLIEPKLNLGQRVTMSPV